MVCLRNICINTLHKGDDDDDDDDDDNDNNNNNNNNNVTFHIVLFPQQVGHANRQYAEANISSDL